MSEVLNHFSVSIGVFYTGNLCQQVTYGGADADGGHLHFLQSGRLQLTDQRGNHQVVDEPSVIFFPRPALHRLTASQDDKAEVVCAAVRYGTGTKNPLANALPSCIVVKLSDSHAFKASTELLFDEARHQRPGRLAMINRLSEIFLINLLRHVLEAGLTDQGMLAALSNPKLNSVIVALQAEPSASWSLEKMAALATMSRSRFASTFKATLGQSPGDYLMGLRVVIAQELLKKGKPVSWVANEVGYANTSALARVFRKITGLSPREWLAQEQSSRETID